MRLLVALLYMSVAAPQSVLLPFVAILHPCAHTTKYLLMACSSAFPTDEEQQ